MTKYISEDCLSSSEDSAEVWILVSAGPHLYSTGTGGAGGEGSGRAGGGADRRSAARSAAAVPHDCSIFFKSVFNCSIFLIRQINNII